MGIVAQRSYRMPARTKGFTLVELSIVLVIIGLLIGGILAGQSMISAAKIAAVAAQVQQFDAGVMNFKTKYNGLPGDSKSFGGDGNGVIASGPGTWAALLGSEMLNFWNNLLPDQFITAESGRRQVTPNKAYSSFHS